MAHHIAVERYQRHLWLTVASVSLVGFPTVVALDVLSMGSASAIGGVVGVLVLLGHLVTATRNPNHDVVSNVKRANDLIASQQLKRITAGEPPAETFQSPVPLLHRQVAILLVMALSVVGIVSAEVLRRVNGWVANDAIFPAVVGPGDEFTVYFQERDFKNKAFEERDTKFQGLRSLGSIWGGTSKVRLKVSEFGYTTAGMTAGTQADPEVEGRTVAQKEKTFRPWLRVQVPETENLAWRQCDMRLNLAIKYPVRSKDQAPGSKDINYQFGSANSRKDVSIVMSAPHAGAIYLGTWLIGGIGGCVLMVICSYALTRSSSLSVGHD